MSTTTIPTSPDTPTDRPATGLPCGGVCQPVTWQPGTWACTAADGNVPCLREEGHDGDHVNCVETGGEHTVRHTWADTTEGADIR